MMRGQRPCAREAARERVIAKEIEMMEREMGNNRTAGTRGLRVPYDDTLAWLKMRSCPTRLVASGGAGGCGIG